MRNFSRRLFDVVHSIVMGVIDTGQIDGVAITRDRFALIEQDADSYAFETGDHTNCIVIALTRFPADCQLAMGTQT